jgi:hypothetical protein
MSSFPVASQKMLTVKTGDQFIFVPEGQPELAEAFP